MNKDRGSTNQILIIPRILYSLLRLKLLNLTSSFPPLPGDVLDEQFALLGRIQELVGEQYLSQTTPQQARQNFEESIHSFGFLGGFIREKVHSVRDLMIDGADGELPARFYQPDAQPGHALLVFLHGGGWVIGSLGTCNNLARFLCQHAGCAVLSVNYRLAPEYPFPAAVEDSLAALRWAYEHAAELGIDPHKLLVGGSSAGGTLAAVAAQLVRQEGPPLAGQVLICPVTNAASFDTPSYRAFGEGVFGSSRRDTEWYLNLYAPHPLDRHDPRLSPLLSPNLSGICPALVVTAEFDVARDDGEAYAQRLQAAGVPVTLLRGNGMIHDFPGYFGLIRRAGQYFDQIAVEVRKLAV